jgi:hypothetical protein
MASGLRTAPEFNMFAPSYIFDLEGFAVRMPATYVRILLTLHPFTAGDTVKFQLTPTEYVQQEKNKKADTGDFWGHVYITPTSTLSEAEILGFVKSQFHRVYLNPVAVDIQMDKKMGTATNKVRVGFLPTEMFNTHNLKSLAKLTAPDGSIWYTHISKGAAAKFGVHHICLGYLSTRAPLNLQCGCGEGASSRQATSAAHRAQATAAYQQRLLKRAREDDDPFA